MGLAIVRRRNRRVRFHLKTGETLEGILALEMKRDFVVWNPRILQAEEEGVSVSGHVEIPRENVLFKQVIG